MLGAQAGHRSSAFCAVCPYRPGEKPQGNRRLRVMLFACLPFGKFLFSPPLFFFFLPCFLMCQCTFLHESLCLHGEGCKSRIRLSCFRNQLQKIKKKSTKRENLNENCKMNQEGENWVKRETSKLIIVKPLVLKRDIFDGGKICVV